MGAEPLRSRWADPEIARQRERAMRWGWASQCIAAETYRALVEQLLDGPRKATLSSSSDDSPSGTSAYWLLAVAETPGRSLRERVSQVSHRWQT
jgi:hypothetical protein